MAYGDYGAFVYRNGNRCKDKEDASLFEAERGVYKFGHGIMGDGYIRVLCYKQGLPEIYEMTENGVTEVKYCEEDIDPYEYDSIKFKHKGYEFVFQGGSPYYAIMREPNGTEWKCEYDYHYGAGFEKA